MTLTSFEPNYKASRPAVPDRGHLPADVRPSASQGQRTPRVRSRRYALMSWASLARHTAATTLPLLGVSERAVIDIMGWSSAKMTLVYQHITDSVRKDVAEKVGSFPRGASRFTESHHRASAVPSGRTAPDKPEQPKSNSAVGPSADYNRDQN